MLMVIFGAGASYDSSPGFPPPSIPASQQNIGNSPVQSLSREQWRPPLANQLFLDPHGAFGDIVQNYVRLFPILPYLRQPSNGSVEEQLERLHKESNGDKERLRQLAAVKYYLRDLLWRVSDRWRSATSGVTNYGTLIDQVRHLGTEEQPLCLVTFNYDLLLDRALESFGYRPQYPEDQFNAHPSIKLFKPHGSVDWARFVVTSPGAGVSREVFIENAETIQLTDKFIRHPHLEDADLMVTGGYTFPAIAIPFQNKSDNTFEWPDSHRKYFEQLLPNVTKIFIIGWAAKEAHFLQILRNSKLPLLQHIMVVGSNSTDARETLTYFVAQIGKRIGADLVGHNCSTGSQGLTQFIIGREAEEFL